MHPAQAVRPGKVPALPAAHRDRGATGHTGRVLRAAGALHQNTFLVADRQPDSLALLKPETH